MFNTKVSLLVPFLRAIPGIQVEEVDGDHIPSDLIPDWCVKLTTVDGRVWIGEGETGKVTIYSQPKGDVQKPWVTEDKLENIVDTLGKALAFLRR